MAVGKFEGSRGRINYESTALKCQTYVKFLYDRSKTNWHLMAEATCGK